MDKKADKQKIIEKVKMFNKRIKKKYAVESMIIFGSIACGVITEDSDVDIIVVSKKYSRKDFLKIVPELYNEWHLKCRIGYPVDFLLYNREEFEELSKDVSIVSVALKEGIRV